MATPIGLVAGGANTATSSNSSKWMLSPTLEVSSEEKTSLISKLKTDSECGIPGAVGGAGEGVSGYVKLPVEDRNKYEKLRSKDQPTSDDSDSEASEFFQQDSDEGGGGIFRQMQMVTSNLPETIHKIQQVAYHKVDKTAHLPIVKKLRDKTKKPTTAAHQAAQQLNLMAAAVAATSVSDSARCPNRGSLTCRSRRCRSTSRILRSTISSVVPLEYVPKQWIWMAIWWTILFSIADKDRER